MLINPCWDVYQVATTCPLLWDVLGFPGSIGYLPEGASVYFNRTDVQRAVNAPIQEWEECSNGVLDDDTSPPSGLSILPRVIEKKDFRGDELTVETEPDCVGAEGRRDDPKGADSFASIQRDHRDRGDDRCGDREPAEIGRGKRRQPEKVAHRGCRVRHCRRLAGHVRSFLCPIPGEPARLRPPPTRG